MAIFQTLPFQVSDILFTWSNRHSAISTFKKVHEEYSVQFDLFPLEHQYYRNIVHFTTGDNCCNLGTNIPGVWMNEVFMLLFSCGINDNGYFDTYGDNTKIPLRQWAKIEITQRKNGAGIYSRRWPMSRMRR